MNGWMVLLLILMALFLLGKIPVGAAAEYGEDGPKAWVRLGPIRLQVFPLPKKKKKPRPKGDKAGGKPAAKPAQQGKPKGGSSPSVKNSGTEKKEESKAEKPPLKEKIGGALELAQALLPLALEAAGRFRRKLRMDQLELILTVGASDPADAALRYGQANAVLGAFWHPLTRAFQVRDGRACATVDFEAEGMTLYARAALSIQIGQALYLGLYYGIRALARWLKLRNRQKAGNEKEKAV